MRHLVLSALCALLLAPALVTSADARPTLRPELRPSQLALSMPSIAKLSSGPVKVLDAKGKYAASYKLEASLHAVGDRLDLLFKQRTVLPDGHRVLGFTRTSWGEIHALVGNGNSGQVVHFIPSGRYTIARVSSDVLTPTAIVAKGR